MKLKVTATVELEFYFNEDEVEKDVLASELETGFALTKNEIPVGIIEEIGDDCKSVVITSFEVIQDEVV